MNVPGRPMSAQEVSDVVAWLAAQRPQFPGQPYPNPSGGLRDESNSMSTSTESSRRELLAKVGLLFNGSSARFWPCRSCVILLSPVTRGRKPGYESWLSLGELEQFPAGQTRLATYRNPVVNSWDGQTGGYSLLGPKRGRQEFPGVRDQLRAPRMSGALVPAVEPVHVSVPRRRLLSDGSRAAGPPPRGLFQYQLQDRGRKTFDQGRRNADDRESHRAISTRGDRHAPDRESLASGSISACKLGASIRETAGHRVPREPQVGSTSSAAPRSPSSCFRSSPAFCSR